MQHNSEEGQPQKEQKEINGEIVRDQENSDLNKEKLTLQGKKDPIFDKKIEWLPYHRPAVKDIDLTMEKPTSDRLDIKRSKLDQPSAVADQQLPGQLPSSQYQPRQPDPLRETGVLPTNPRQQRNTIEQGVAPQLPRLPLTNEPTKQSYASGQSQNADESVRREANYMNKPQQPVLAMSQKAPHNPQQALREDSSSLSKDNPEEGQSKLIMVVDDSQTVRNIMALILNRAGYRSVRVTSAMEALHMLTEVTPDLIFLDITLPGMDGLDVCKIIKENPRTKQVPVIMLSGNNEVFDKVMGRLAGASDYITKPFEPEKILNCLQSFLGKKKGLREGLWQGIR